MIGSLPSTDRKPRITGILGSFDLVLATWASHQGRNGANAHIRNMSKSDRQMSPDPAIAISASTVNVELSIIFSYVKRAQLVRRSHQG